MKFEYKSVLLTIDRAGWSQALQPESVNKVQQSLDRLGGEGWELVAVWPITNGGSPAQIDHAIHYFKRQID